MKTKEEFGEYLFCLGFDNDYVKQFIGGEIFHYTSPESFDKIMFSGENDTKIKLYASRYDCVNDTSEGKYVIDVYNSVVKDLYDAISEDKYMTIKNLLPTNHSLIRKYKDEECVHVSEKMCDMYICCFSKDGDSLPMWNYYSKDSKYQGYNIGIDGIEAIENLHKYRSDVNIKWYEVIYDIKTQKEIIKTFLLEILEYYLPERKSTIQYVISSKLTEWSMIFKKSYFTHENEVRVVIYIPKKEGCKHFPVKYRQKGMFKIPYIVFELEKECLTSVGISPLYCTEGEKEQQISILKEQLYSNRYDFFDVIPSEIPIRY